VVGSRALMLIRFMSAQFVGRWMIGWCRRRQVNRQRRWSTTRGIPDLIYSILWPLWQVLLEVKVVLILEIRRHVWYRRHVNFWNETDPASRSFRVVIRVQAHFGKVQLSARQHEVQSASL
jgi:hypothetical protein